MKRILRFSSQGFEDREAVTMTDVPGRIQIFFVILSIFLSSGCMMHGMKMDENMMDIMMGKSTKEVQRINSSQIIDKMIEEMVIDLYDSQVKINSVAVWQIQSKTAGLDVETIRLKLISKLVAKNSFNVVARDRLKDLLEEQSLSLSGTINEKNAIDFGNLIGVEAFIDGYCYLKDNRFILNLHLIETKRGVILWAKIIEKAL